ncbi:MAG: OmpA family protein [Desulfobacteraceae bacterium]|nr:OmpA family protein [Desulfobacteraceae bacterium]
MMRHIVICLCLTCLIACAKQQKNSAILLPQESGETGKIVMRSDTSGIMLDKPYTEVVYHATTGGFLTRKTDPGQVQKAYGPLLGAEPHVPALFTLYFMSGPAELTPESKSMLPKILEIAGQKASSDIDIIGHTDTMGSAETNTRLSLARARRVADILSSHGINEKRLSIQGHGENDLLVPTPGSTPEPRNNRVEVMIR